MGLAYGSHRKYHFLKLGLKLAEMYQLGSIKENTYTEIGGSSSNKLLGSAASLSQGKRSFIERILQSLNKIA